METVHTARVGSQNNIPPRHSKTRILPRERDQGSRGKRRGYRERQRGRESGDGGGEEGGGREVEREGGRWSGREGGLGSESRGRGYVYVRAGEPAQMTERSTALLAARPAARAANLDPGRAAQRRQEWLRVLQRSEKPSPLHPCQKRRAWFKGQRSWKPRPFTSAHNYKMAARGQWLLRCLAPSLRFSSHARSRPMSSEPGQDSQPEVIPVPQYTPRDGENTDTKRARLMMQSR